MTRKHHITNNRLVAKANSKHTSTWKRNTSNNFYNPKNAGGTKELRNEGSNQAANNKWRQPGMGLTEYKNKISNNTERLHSQNNLKSSYQEQKMTWKVYCSALT